MKLCLGAWAQSVLNPKLNLEWVLMLYILFYTGKVLPAVGVYCVPVEFCSLQGTHLTVNSAQRSNFCQLQYHMYANLAQHSQVR
jgi:hypothetical protein